MFEVSTKMQEFINQDCDMDGELVRNFLKEFGGEAEFLRKYEGYVKKGVNQDTPHFNNSRLMTKLYEDNQTNSLIWARAHTAQQGHDSIAEWLDNLDNTYDGWLVEDINQGLRNSESEAYAEIPMVLMMEIAYQICYQYKEFATDFEGS